jgi:uncharacterized membrane protein YhaH (DUF805 family)
MVKLFLSPKGRIGPSAFMQGAIILIVIGFVLNAAPAFLPDLATPLGFVGLLFIWPWISIWIKRLHDSGQSGWMILLVVLVYFILSMIAGQVLGSAMGVDQMAIMKAGFSGDTALVAELAEKAKVLILPGSVVSAIISFVYIFIVNKLLKSDPEENQFGGPTG